MRKYATLPDGLAVITRLYSDHLIFTGTIIAALFAGSYLLG